MGIKGMKGKGRKELKLSNFSPLFKYEKEKESLKKSWTWEYKLLFQLFIWNVLIKRVLLRSLFAKEEVTQFEWNLRIGAVMIWGESRDSKDKSSFLQIYYTNLASLSKIPAAVEVEVFGLLIFFRTLIFM